MALAPGDRLGPYEVLAPLGAGGMGEVYRARDSRLGRVAAVKVLRQELSADGERLARFEQEARAASALNHPNIVTIYDIGSSGGTAYVGMELVEGSTLRELLADGPLSPRRLLPIGAQIAEGLAAAHEVGITHRDVKPENLMVTREGRVKILDFGLAKLAPVYSEKGSQLPTEGQVTQPGTVLGTVSYMSPEQVRGLALDCRTDIFSLGSMLYEMACGSRPFRGTTPAETMTAILRDEPPELHPAVPPALERIIRRCLEKAPEQRFQSARDLAFALETSSDSAPQAAAAAPRRPRSRPVVWIAAAALAAFGAGLLLRPLLPRAAAPSFSRVVRLTSGPRQEFGAAISPDGKWVAYFSNARGPVDVWVKFVAGGEAVNLTEKSGLYIPSRANVGGLGISPDGALIAFDAGPALRPRPDETWVVPAPLGGQPRRLVSQGRSVRWSPDGRRIVFVRPGSHRGDALYVADADGGNPKEILAARGGLHAHWPAWSRDGRFVYFVYGTSTWNIEPSEIARVPSSGGEPELLFRTSRRAVFPVPLRDGLIYAANPDSADLALWWTPLTARGPMRLTTGVGEYAEPSVSADERQMIATYVEARQALVSVPVRFGTAASSPRVLTDGFLGDFDPAVSPRGDRLVWSSARSGNRNLWIGNPDATDARPLTSGPAFDERPAFSPDGSQVAFVSDRGGERGIWLVSAEGGAPRLLAAARVLDTLSWSPDAGEIVFAAPAGDLPGLYRVGLGNGKVELLPTPSGGFAPAWRPRRPEIAYLEVISPLETRLRFVDPSGRPLRDGLPVGPNFMNGMLAWTPEGDRLAALAIPAAADAVIHVVEPESGEPFRRLLTLSAPTQVRGIAWSPDAGSILYGDHQPTSDIVLFDRNP
jgi:Tol biopolymer transport system component